MFSHQQENPHTVGFGGANMAASSGPAKSESANGEIIRRQVRTSAASHQPVQLKVPPSPQQQLFWIPSQPYPISTSNGFLNHVMTPANDTLRPISAVDDNAIALQSFNTSIAQRAGIAPANPGQAFTPEMGRGAMVTNAMERIPGVEIATGSIDEAHEYRRAYAGLAGTVGVGIGASLMAILAFQLLLNLNYYESPTLSGLQLTGGSTPQILRDLSTALCTITLTCSLCAIMSSFLHFYLCFRIIGHAFGTSEWKERIDRYRQRTVYIRALSNGGFFVGVIVFMLAMITYQQLLNTVFGSTISSVVATVIIGIGALFCTVTLAMGFYFAGLCQELRPASRLAQAQEPEKRGTLV